jgi:hypothetical protein
MSSTKLVQHIQFHQKPDTRHMFDSCRYTCAAGALPDNLLDVYDRVLGDKPLHPQAAEQGVDGDPPHLGGSVRPPEGLPQVGGRGGRLQTAASAREGVSLAL